VQASDQLRPNLVVIPNVLKVCLIAAGISMTRTRAKGESSLLWVHDKKVKSHAALSPSSALRSQKS
jgi:hypothetical protein